MNDTIITDADLERLTELPSSARDAWTMRHVERLTARGVEIDVPAEALAALSRHANRCTWSGDVRGG